MASSETLRTTMNGKPVYSVPVRSVLNLESGFQHKLLCDGPTFSLGDSCTYGCTFCYVPSIYRKLERVSNILETTGLKHADVVIRREQPNAILRKQLLREDGTPRFKDPADRRVVYGSPVVDVAANMELVRETVEACRLFLAHTNWSIRLLSKSHLLPKVATLLTEAAQTDHTWGVTPEQVRTRMIFGVSTGTLDDKLAASFELETALVGKRIASLHWLQDRGFRVFGMVCPSLPQANAEGYENFSRSVLAALRPDRCEHIWAEVVNARGEAMESTVAALAAAGFHDEAAAVRRVGTDKAAWEQYNRSTFLAHAEALSGFPGKLRYLTYVTATTRDFWLTQRERGAVLLGKAAAA